MGKKILILTSQKSGGGHRSSSDAIKAAILKRTDSVDVKDVDAMEFMPGYTGEESGYIAFTTRYRIFWKLFFECTSLFYGVSNFFLYKTIFKGCQKLINEYQPDIILSVNPCFVGSVKRCLKKMKLETPFCVCIIDLVKHSRLWWEKESDITFVPTRKMYDLLLEKGFKESRLIHSGFPIRDRFDHQSKSPAAKLGIRGGFDLPNIAAQQVNPKLVAQQIDGYRANVLMVNASLCGNEANLALIRSVLQYPVNVTVVTGNNVHLKDYLTEMLSGVKQITILGYTLEMVDLLAKADVLVTKAGPNMILEAVKMCVPVLITGHILGQEEKNYQYIVEHGYGFACESPEKLQATLGLLFENDYKLLKEISHNQQNCTDLGGAEVVAEHLVTYPIGKTRDF